MVKRCVAANCSNTTSSTVSLFSFPSDVNLKRQWVAQVKRTRAMWKGPTPHDRLCSQHFTSDSFQSRPALLKDFGLPCAYKLQLKTDAVPSIFDRTATKKKKAITEVPSSAAAASSSETPERCDTDTSYVTPQMPDPHPERSAFTKRERRRNLQDIFDTCQESCQKSATEVLATPMDTTVGCQTDPKQNRMPVRHMKCQARPKQCHYRSKGSQTATELQACDTPVLSTICTTETAVQCNLVDAPPLKLLEPDGLSDDDQCLSDDNDPTDEDYTPSPTEIEEMEAELEADVDDDDVSDCNKGFSKKVTALGKLKDCEDVLLWAQSMTNHLYYSATSCAPGEGDLMLSKWLSVSNHIQNIHSHDDERFPACLHGPLPPNHRRWLKAGSKAAVKLEELIHSRQLMKDIQKLSSIHQTSALEAFHSVIIHFAPKMLGFSHRGMDCRTKLSALHYNENAARPQATKRDGTGRYKIRFPKYKKGGFVVQKILQDPTYEYVAELMVLAYAMPGQEAAPIPVRPQSLASECERPDKCAAVAAHRTRFQHCEN